MAKINTKILGSLVSIRTGKLDANMSSPNGIYPFFTCSVDPLKIDNYSYDCECVLVAGNGDLNVKYYNGKFDAYQRTYIIESIDKKRLITKYLFYFMMNYIDVLRKNSIGGVIKYIKLSDLTNIKIPLPNIEGQMKIVEVLEKAEKAKEKRNEADRLTDEYLKSVFVEMFGDPATNVDNCNWSKFGDYLISIDSGWSPKCHERKTLENEWGILKLSAVTKGVYDESENKTLPIEYSPKLNIEVTKGDLLFSRKNTRELVGACAYVFNTKENLMLPDTIFRFNTKDDINKIYLWVLFCNSAFKKIIQNLASGSSGSMPNISKEKLYKLEIPVPPIALQNRFAEIVNTVGILKLKQKQSAIEIDTLFKSLMQKAFKGEL